MQYSSMLVYNGFRLRIRTFTPGYGRIRLGRGKMLREFQRKEAVVLLSGTSMAM